MRIRIHNTARRFRFSSNMAKTLYLRVTAVPSRSLYWIFSLNNVIYSVPNPDLPDLHVFGPPGSTNQRYGSGSGPGSFYHQAKIVRKTYCFVTSFGLFIFYLENVPSKCNKQKSFFEKVLYLLTYWRSKTDPDPQPNVMDPEHWLSWC